MHGPLAFRQQVEVQRELIGNGYFSFRLLASMGKGLTS